MSRSKIWRTKPIEAVALVDLNVKSGERLGDMAVAVWLVGGPAGAMVHLLYPCSCSSTRPSSPSPWYQIVAGEISYSNNERTTGGANSQPTVLSRGVVV